MPHSLTRLGREFLIVLMRDVAVAEKTTTFFGQAQFGELRHGQAEAHAQTTGSEMKCSAAHPVVKN